MCGDDQRPDHDVDTHSIARDEGKCTLLNTLIGNFVVVYEEEDILYEMWRDGKGDCIERSDWMMEPSAKARGREERARKRNAEEELSMRETEGNRASRASFSFRYFTRFDVAVTDVWMNEGGEAPRLFSFRRREGMRRRRRQ